MPLDFDDIRDLREEWEVTLDANAYRERISAYVDTMASGDVGRAELLLALCERTLMDEPSTEDLERAAEHAREAFADGGPTTSDPRLELLRVLDRLGREDEVNGLIRECLRDRTPDHVEMDIHAELGEILELRGRLRDAHRAYTVGLKEFEPDLDEPDFEEDTCLAGRYRVRRELALGFDSLDRAFQNLSPDPAKAIRDRAANS